MGIRHFSFFLYILIGLVLLVAVDTGMAMFYIIIQSTMDSITWHIETCVQIRTIPLTQYQLLSKTLYLMYSYNNLRDD